MIDKKQKLVVCIMGDSCGKFLDMCFKSIINADKIVFCWGMEDIDTLKKYNEWKNKYPIKFELIKNKFDQKDKTMNGKQRNIYLQYLKDNYMNWNCLCMDADEILSENGIEKIKYFLENE